MSAIGDYTVMWEAIDTYVNENDSGDTRPLVEHLLAIGFHRSEKPTRITIEHENGNTVTGTLDQVLNSGHLKTGWKYRDVETLKLTYEYSPGYLYVRDGELTAFVQNGTLAPGYVSDYIKEGGRVLRRKVGPWEKVEE